MKCHVLVCYDATVAHTIEGESLDDVVDAAWEAAQPIAICHQCAYEIDINDAFRIIVSNEDGMTELYDSDKAEGITTTAKQNLALIIRTIREARSDAGKLKDVFELAEKFDTPA